jgi:hypothetical protein
VRRETSVMRSLPPNEHTELAGVPPGLKPNILMIGLFPGLKVRGWHNG